MPRPPSALSVEQRILAKLQKKLNVDSLTLVAPSDLASIGSRPVGTPWQRAILEFGDVPPQRSKAVL